MVLFVKRDAWYDCFRPVAAVAVSRHTRPMREADSDPHGGRGYAAIGCLALFVLPISLLSEWLDGRLTWVTALAWTIEAAILLGAPLFFIGRNRNDRLPPRLCENCLMW
jgi:hypothetical protein